MQYFKNIINKIVNLIYVQEQRWYNNNELGEKWDMGNRLLKPLFKDVFGRSINPKEFDDRMLLQKLVYILQELGHEVDDYSFSWYKHGPYSQKLQNDILYISYTPYLQNINYTNSTKTDIENLKCLFENRGEYSLEFWAECIASLIMLKKYILPINTSREDILSEITKRKPHLNSEIDNYRALEWIERNILKNEARYN